MMDVVDLGAWMDRHFTASAFRLETLQAYEVATDGSDYRRYLDGEPTWTPQRKQPWLDRLAGEVAGGRFRHRVRIVTRPVTPYTRYECEWSYAPNSAAGEGVRILDDADHRRPHVGGLDESDWWLVIDSDGAQRVAEMHYDDGGRFLGATEVAPERVAGYAEARDALWTAAEDFATWWNRHPELDRTGTPAA